MLQMPKPKVVTASKRFLGMVTYLAKFMRHLSEMTEPLRRLEDKKVEFQWLPRYSLAMNTIEKFLTETPTCSSLFAGSRIITYVEHLNIDLSLPLSYSIIICCCCCQCCNGKGCGVTCVTIVMWSASHTNRRAPWYLSRHKQKPELDVKKFCCSLTCSSVILLSPKLHSRKYWKLHGMSSM